MGFIVGWVWWLVGAWWVGWCVVVDGCVGERWLLLVGWLMLGWLAVYVDGMNTRTMGWDGVIRAGGSKVHPSHVIRPLVDLSAHSLLTMAQYPPVLSPVSFLCVGDNSKLSNQLLAPHRSRVHAPNLVARRHSRSPSIARSLLSLIPTGPDPLCSFNQKKQKPAPTQISLQFLQDGLYVPSPFLLPPRATSNHDLTLPPRSR
jgi:hypothetical protein